MCFALCTLEEPSTFVFSLVSDADHCSTVLNNSAFVHAHNMTITVTMLRSGKEIRQHCLILLQYFKIVNYISNTLHDSPFIFQTFFPLRNYVCNWNSTILDSQMLTLLYELGKNIAYLTKGNIFNIISWFNIV